MTIDAILMMKQAWVELTTTSSHLHKSTFTRKHCNMFYHIVNDDDGRDMIMKSETLHGCKNYNKGHLQKR